jgi:signal transduction histidine kinase
MAVATYAGLPRRTAGGAGAGQRTAHDVAVFVLAAIKGLIESDRLGASLGLLDGAGRLRTVASEGVRIGGSCRSRSIRRRHVLRTGVPMSLTVRERTTESVELIPLINVGVAVGVLEVQAPTVALKVSREPLLMVAEQAAQMLRGMRDWRQTDLFGEAFGGALDLATELMGENAREVVGRAVGYLHEWLRLPVAGWISAADGAPLELVSTRGLSRTASDAVLRESRRQFTHPDDASFELAAVLGRALGGTNVRRVSAGRAVLLVGGVAEGALPVLEAVRVLLSEALGRVELVERAAQRDEALNTGLAATAHEVRQSLEGIRLAVEAVRVVGDTDAEGRRLLERARRELDRLSYDVDSVLRWSVGDRAIRRRQTDLMRLVRNVVTATSGIEADRFVVDGPRSLMVPADVANLRTAVANLLRNAVAYADSDQPVTVRVVPSEGWVVLSVRDHGPGVPAEERESIFDPFVRGRSAHGRSGNGRTGNGLGLFVARRVAEAHGGAIWCESDREGATFMLRLPAVVGGRSSTAS